MNCANWSEKLHADAEGKLAAGETRALDAHLAACAHCRDHLASLRRLLAHAAQLEKSTAPARDLWPAIAAQLATSRVPRRRPLCWLPPLAAAACGALFLAAVFWQRTSTDRSAAWPVAAVAGTPHLAATAFQGRTHLRLGQWLETDDTARAKLAVGRIGEVDIEPNSRVRLVAATATDHRLELSRGTLHALIWAPPRLFFVETPSATAVDLGCAYTLTVDDDGGSTLTVTAGYVALEHAGRESIVPAGAMCLTRRAAAPGTPFVTDAAPELRRALERFDFANAARDALPTILAHARSADAVTLWHLLTRTSGIERAQVYEILAQHRPPPSTVTRDGILQGEKSMLAAWADDLGLSGW